MLKLFGFIFGSQTSKIRNVSIPLTIHYMVIVLLNILIMYVFVFFLRI